MADEKVTDRYGQEVTWKEMTKGMTARQVTCWRYFLFWPEKEGCFSKTYLSGEEYLALVEEEVGDLESRKMRALSKLGVDEDQVNEIPPVFFRGFVRLEDEKNNPVRLQLARVTAQGERVTPTRELTWIFFGDEQIYVYRSRVDMLNDDIKSERTFEYFYKDVTSFTATSDSARYNELQVSKGCGGEKREFVAISVDSETFQISVAGDRFECALTAQDDNESKISAMKQKLREKKTA